MFGIMTLRVLIEIIFEELFTTQLKFLKVSQSFSQNQKLSRFHLFSHYNFMIFSFIKEAPNCVWNFVFNLLNTCAFCNNKVESVAEVLACLCFSPNINRGAQTVLSSTCSFSFTKFLQWYFSAQHRCGWIFYLRTKLKQT